MAWFFFEFHSEFHLNYFLIFDFSAFPPHAFDKHFPWIQYRFYIKSYFTVITADGMNLSLFASVARSMHVGRIRFSIYLTTYSFKRISLGRVFRCVFWLFGLKCTLVPESVTVGCDEIFDRVSCTFRPCSSSHCVHADVLMYVFFHADG